MEITKREIIVSITIIAVWICFGILIAGKIDAWQQDKYAEYDRVARITQEDLFVHGMKTNLGNAFVYGELQAADPVTYPEIDGQYSYIEKIKERYTQHTRTVTKTRTRADGKTETYTDTETYWSWDYVSGESKTSEEFVFLNQQFSRDRFILPSTDYIKTIKESYYVRYQYYGIPEKITGTLYTALSEGTIQENSKFYEMTIEETVDMLESDCLMFFWIVWIIILIAVVVLFYKADNDWLNEG